MDPSDANIHAGHRRRMREKICAMGVDGLTDHEIIEFLLFYAIPKRDVNPLAHRLLASFGSLAGVLNAGEAELTAIDGVGAGVARVIVAFGAMLAECLSARETPACRVVTVEDAAAAAAARFVHPTRQELAALCTAEDGLLLNCVVRDWDILLSPENARWLLEAAMDNRAHHLTLVWKRYGRVRRLVKAELNDLNRLLTLLGAAEVYLDDLILVYHDGVVSLRQSGVLNDERRRAANESGRMSGASPDEGA